jgi:hypothetical protein
MKTLKDIFAKHGCDKFEHQYYKEYEKHLEPIKDQPLHLLEVGIWKGTSHQSWYDYLPNAQIYGIDIFSRITPEEVPALALDRVHWFVGDSTTPNIPRLVSNWNIEGGLDVIIDDGLHTPEANGYTFLNLYPHLKKGGVYYIEDVWPLDMMSDAEMKHPWIVGREDKYNHKTWSKFWNIIQESGGIVERIDNRDKSFMRDSYLIKITK